ncbi:MAG TPA: hypothetical protein PLD84_06605 [Chitinophagales bacterium]|nr:hypothetical protein [Chitinophagales bacterium]
MTPSKGDAIMAKPERVYLQNPNLAAAITPLHPDTGTMRETFFFNQLSSMHTVKAATEGDFIVDEKLTFEIGGRSKKPQQLRKTKNAFIVQDNTEYGFENKIPLWLFGFLY